MTISSMIDEARRDFCAEFPTGEPWGVVISERQWENLGQSRLAVGSLRSATYIAAEAQTWNGLAILIFERGRFGTAVGPMVVAKHVARDMLSNQICRLA